jgi:hypothetical protein
MAGLPSVPVHDLKIHPRDHELIAATHGRSFWIVDIAPLEQMTAKVMAADVHLFEPKTGFQWGEAPTLGASGNGNAQAFFATPNPSYGAQITYRVGAGKTGQARIYIMNAVGDTLSRLTGSTKPGVHTVTWNYSFARQAAEAEPLSPSARRDSILKAVRGPKVLDSLAAAKYDSAAIATARTLMEDQPGGGGRGFGGGFGGGGTACERPLTQFDTFCARPAEAAVARPGLEESAPTSARALFAAASRPEVARIFELIGIPTPSRGRGFFGFGGGGDGATTGDYGVVLKIGDTVVKQTLRVEDAGMSGWARLFGGPDM